MNQEDENIENEEEAQAEEATPILTGKDKSKKPPKTVTSEKRVHEILKRAKRPSVVLRHKKVLDKMSEAVGKKKGKKNESEILESEGYSESYAKSGHIKKTKTWSELLEEYLPDEELNKHHKMLLNAAKIGTQTFSMGVKDEEIIEVINSFGFEVMKILFVKGLGKVAYYPIPDNIAKKYALEMAHKLKQKYGDLTIVHKFGSLSDEEIEEEIAGILSETLGVEEGEKKKRRKQ